MSIFGRFFVQCILGFVRVVLGEWFISKFENVAKPWTLLRGWGFFVKKLRRFIYEKIRLLLIAVGFFRNSLSCQFIC